jgi:hypothetical protein
MFETPRPVSRANIVFAAVGTLAIVAAGWLYWAAHKPVEKAGEVAIAKPAPEVASAPRIDKPLKSVKVYKGGSTIKDKLNLPPAVVADQKTEVIASSKIEAGERPRTVTTVINTETGASETYVRTDPRPWLAFERRGEIGAYYGIKAGEPTIRIQARQDFVQVKALHIGVIGSVDRTMATGHTDYFVGVGVSYRW